MTGFGFFLFLCVVVYLIDKNRAWGSLWRACKAIAIVALVFLLLWGGYGYWNERRAKSAAVFLDFSKAQPIPANDPYAGIATPETELEDYAALKPWEKVCVDRVRAKYPSAYTDFSDVELSKHLKKKYGERCPL